MYVLYELDKKIGEYETKNDIIHALSRPVMEKAVSIDNYSVYDEHGRQLELYIDIQVGDVLDEK